MGKESKLRNPKPDTGTRFAYTNGDRKLNDRDKPPAGVDPDIWDASMYFEQLAEERGYMSPGRPVIYTEIYHRVSNDSTLSDIIAVGSNSLARTRDTCGMCSTDILRAMITIYWDYHYTNTSNDSKQSINDFCSLIVFDYHKDYVIDSSFRKTLLTTGIRKPQVDREIKPSRRTEEEKEVARIKLGDRTHEESLEKMKKFKGEI